MSSNTSEWFEFRQEIFNEMTGLIPGFLRRAGLQTVVLRRDDRFNAALSQGKYDTLPSVRGLISQHRVGLHLTAIKLSEGEHLGSPLPSRFTKGLVGADRRVCP